MKQFKSAAAESKAVRNAVPIEFAFDHLEMVANPPTTGQLVLLMTTDTEGSPGVLLRSVMEFFQGILDEDDYNALRDHIKSGGDINVLAEIMEWLVEQWSTRPTKPSSASSRSRTSTGRASTRKQPAKASTT